MPSRTQIVCLHEGKDGRSIDPLFIRALIKALDPAWIRPWEGSNVVRTVACGGRSELGKQVASEISACAAMGSKTTLMVWADLDDDMADGDSLVADMWNTAKASGVSRQEFDNVVFVFAKDRIENWIEFLETGATKEEREGPRIKFPRQASDAAKRLAEICRTSQKIDLPPSLSWSCKNWKRLVARMAD
ncbi:MAG: hypothetical protein P4L46_23755 [Fimbriimonas sp.]|nr:hypothetical protein [Fimbriimonas sp.]